MLPEDLTLSRENKIAGCESLEEASKGSCPEHGIRIIRRFHAVLRHVATAEHTSQDPTKKAKVARQVGITRGSTPGLQQSIHARVPTHESMT